MNKSRFVVVNISWNDHEWRVPRHDPKAGHRYVQRHLGHESFNFRFDKDVDTEEHVYGYAFRMGRLPHLVSPGVVFFWTRNIRTQKRFIVGAYGGASAVNPQIKVKQEGFRDGWFGLNLMGRKAASLLFPAYLDADRYSKWPRFVPLCGFRTIEPDTASEIVSDEIATARQKGCAPGDLEKLHSLSGLADEYSKAGAG